MEIKDYEIQCLGDTTEHKDNNSMNCSRRSNKLTNIMNNISNVRTCNGEIYQVANNSTI